MDKIIIKTCPESKFLRTEAMAKAIEFEEVYVSDKKEGVMNGVLWVKYANEGKREWQIYAYKTKRSIIVDVRMSAR